MDNRRNLHPSEQRPIADEEITSNVAAREKHVADIAARRYDVRHISVWSYEISTDVGEYDVMNTGLSQPF
jgi:hypothetical protein